jgi:hypothetical protein
VPLIWEKAMSESAKIKLLGDNAIKFLPRLASSVETCSRSKL